MIPTFMGYPLWINLKKRIAKKHLAKCFRNNEIFQQMHAYKVGDFIHDCSGFNVKIFDMEACYRRVGHGLVLVDIDITTNKEGGSCSFKCCGVSPALSREEIIQSWENRVKYYNSYGDTWNFAKRYEFTSVDENGMAVFDHTGYKTRYGDL